MKCPKCGYHRQASDNAFTPATECPACGIVYSKHAHKKPAVSIGGTAPPPHIKPSPVDAVSLKLARERIEKRLRKQLEHKVKDERHEATLKLARRFASQAVRNRQKSYQQSAKIQPAKTERRAEQTAPGVHAETVSAKHGSKSQVADKTTTVQAAVADVTPDRQHLQSSAPATPPHQTHALRDAKTTAKPDVMTQTIILEASDIASPPPRPAASADHQSRGDSQADEVLEKTLDSEKEETVAVNAMLADSDRLPQRRTAGSMMRLLSSVAWLILLAGVIGAFLSWTTIRDAQAGVNIPVPGNLSTLPLGLLLGFAYLATGVLGFAFFWVSSMINRHLTDIRRLLMARTPSMVIGDTIEPELPEAK